MSVTVASEQTKQQKESGSMTKSANLQRREKERKRANGGRAVRGGIVRCAVREYTEQRRCILWRRRLPATRPWGLMVGMSACQGARGIVGRRGGGEGGRVYMRRQGEKEGSEVKGEMQQQQQQQLSLPVPPFVLP